MKTGEGANKRFEHFKLTSKFFLTLTVLCIIALGPAPASADNQFNGPVARTKSGLVIGSTTDGMNEFLGIPYAVPAGRELSLDAAKAVRVLSRICPASDEFRQRMHTTRRNWQRGLPVPECLYAQTNLSKTC